MPTDENLPPTAEAPAPDDAPPENQVSTSRRNFFKAAIASIVTFITATMGIGAMAYVADPATKKTEAANWIKLGAVSKIEIGKPTLYKAKVTVQTGWIVDEREISVYVYTDNGRDFLAISNVCTHLGCRVRWIEEQQIFFCPCHNGQFNKAGGNISGPPPRPLDRYVVKIENNQLYIMGG